MIYITEMAFADPSRLRSGTRTIGATLRTCRLFRASSPPSASRRVADTLSHFSAVHDIASADMFESAIYKTRGGRQSNGDWQPLMINWHRNLYDGLDATPEVAAGLVSAVHRRETRSRRTRDRRAAGCRHSLAQSRRPRPDHPASGHRGDRRSERCSRSPRPTRASRCSGRSPRKFGRQKPIT